MTVIRKVPEDAPLSFWEKWSAWFAMNRKPIGSAILAMSTLVRVFLSFQGHTEVADTMKAIADLFMGTGAALAASGTFKSDDFHEEKINADIRKRSGQYPTYQRRKGDGTKKDPNDRH